MKNCEKFSRDLQAYIEDDLAPEKVAHLLEHLRECSSCAKLASDLKKVVNLLQSVPEISAEPGFTGRVLDNIATNDEGRKRFFRRSLQLAAGIVLVCGISIIAYLKFSPSTPGERLVAKTKAPELKEAAKTINDDAKHEEKNQKDRFSINAQKNQKDKFSINAQKKQKAMFSNNTQSGGGGKGVKAELAGGTSINRKTITKTQLTPAVRSQAYPLKQREKIDYLFTFKDTEKIRLMLKGFGIKDSKKNKLTTNFYLALKKEELKSLMALAGKDLPEEKGIQFKRRKIKDKNQKEYKVKIILR